MRRYLTHALFFFFNDTATTEIYTLSLHDALPICLCRRRPRAGDLLRLPDRQGVQPPRRKGRSEEHTSELQSHLNLVCRLLLEKKKKKRSPRIQLYSRSTTRSLVSVPYSVGPSCLS